MNNTKREGRFSVDKIAPTIIKNEEKDKNLDEVPFEEALQSIGFGKVQIQTTFLCGLILMAVLNETMGMGIIIPAAKCDLQLSSAQTGLLTSISFLGIMVSSHLWGFLADTKGRRKIILYTMLLSNLCTLISSFSINFTMLIVARFFTGFFISASSGTIYAYLGEFNTATNRATVISWASISVGLSNSFLPATGWLVLSQNWSFIIFDFMVKPWRILLTLYAIPGFIGALWLIKFPESPKFLLARGKDTEALQILSWIYTKNTKNPSDQFAVKKLQPEYQQQNDVKPQKGGMGIIKSMWNQTAPLFKPPHWIYFFVCCFMQFGVFAVSGGLGLWFPEIINRVASTDLSNNNTICEMLDASIDDNISNVECNDEVDSKVFVDTLMLGGLYTIAYILISLLIKPVGRGWVLTFCLFTSGTCGLLLQWVYEPIAVVALFSVFLVLSGICISIINGAAVGLFPTTLRGMAVCISMMNGRFGTFAASNTVGILLEQNCNFTFIIFVVIVYACGLANFLLPWR